MSKYLFKRYLTVKDGEIISITMRRYFFFNLRRCVDFKRFELNDYAAIKYQVISTLLTIELRAGNNAVN